MLQISFVPQHSAGIQILSEQWVMSAGIQILSEQWVMSAGIQILSEQWQ
jgi:hypothetical protein